VSATRFLVMIEDADGRWTELGRVAASDEGEALLAIADRAPAEVAVIALPDNGEDGEIRLVHPLTRVEARDAATSGPLATEHGGSDAD
jgi:hypothetical protein